MLYTSTFFTFYTFFKIQKVAIFNVFFAVFRALSRTMDDTEVKGRSSLYVYLNCLTQRRTEHSKQQAIDSSTFTFTLKLQ